MINRRAFFQALAGVPVAAAVAKAAPPQTSFIGYFDVGELSEAMRKDYARAFCTLGLAPLPTEVTVTDGRVMLFGGRIANVSYSVP